VAYASYRQRTFTYRIAEDGSVEFEGRLPAESGALLLLALERASDWLSLAADREARNTGTAYDDAPLLSAAVRRADAMAALAERFLATPPAIQRALRRRDGGCRFPGCVNRRFVDGHHIVHWIDGGITNLDNLVLLCRHHHRIVHEGGCYIERDADNLLFVRRDGTRILPVNDTLGPERVPRHIAGEVAEPLRAWRVASMPRGDGYPFASGAAPP
jgi:hypothetical protein